MSENMLTIDRVSNFTVVQASRLIQIIKHLLVWLGRGELSATDLSDIGVLEGSNQTTHPIEYLTLLCLSVV